MKTTRQNALGGIALGTLVTAFISNAVESNRKCVMFDYGSERHCVNHGSLGIWCEKTEYFDANWQPTYWNKCVAAGINDSCTYAGTIDGHVVEYYGECSYNHNGSHYWWQGIVSDGLVRCSGTNCYE